MAVVVEIGQSRRDNIKRALDQLTTLVADDLKRVNQVIVDKMDSPVALIPQLAGHIIAAGGKRLRPLITLAAADLCGLPVRLQWRPLIATVLLISLVVCSGIRRFWNVSLLIIWIDGLLAVGILMWGGVLGLTPVETARWGGLPLTLILSTFGIAFAFPLGVLLALGRRSRLPAIKAICVVYIELIRGVPLISLLFMSSVMLPLFLPEGVSIDKL